MKLVILVIAIFINFFNHSLSNSEEKINSTNNIIDNIAKKESPTEDKSEIRKIHIVKIGDTISNISKLFLFIDGKYIGCNEVSFRRVSSNHWFKVIYFISSFLCLCG